VTNRKGLLQQLEDNEADIVLMGVPPPEVDLVAEAFMDNPLVIIAPAEHALAGKSGLGLDDLRGETFLMRDRARAPRWSVSWLSVV
jgi:DNA-binding transcriptional LysR family regulator